MSQPSVPYSLPSAPPGQVPPTYRQFYRCLSGRKVAGVASGLAKYLGIPVLWVRLALVAGCFLDGSGLVFYALVWAFTRLDSEEDSAEHSRTKTDGRLFNLLLMLIAMVGTFASVTVLLSFKISLLIPLAIVCVGVAMVWISYDRGLNSMWSTLSISTGGALVLVAIVFILSKWNTQADFGTALAAVILTLCGVGALGIPLWLRLWEALGKERAEKAAADERAEIASRLHDSVLQTLALIQKHADDSVEVARLARGQERELRQWLFDSSSTPPQSTGSVFTALIRVCAEIEDQYGIRVSLVRVGEDIPLTDDVYKAAMAAREALVNVAKHAGVDAADVYVELLLGQLSIFVRDRGCGFDPGCIPEGHHGISDSICGRVKRAGGSVDITSEPGQGTEVSITMDLR